MIITTVCTDGNRSWNSAARSAARAPASSESNAMTARWAKRDELPEVPLPQRGAACRDRVLDAGLREPDHVGVSLDDERLAAPRDGGPSAVQVVEHLVLLVDRRLGGVEVLRLLAGPGVARQDARAEPDAVPLQVVDRERQAPAEPVAHRSVVATGREARLEQRSRGSGRAPARAGGAGSRGSPARSRSRTSRPPRARCPARRRRRGRRRPPYRRRASARTARPPARSRGYSAWRRAAARRSAASRPRTAGGRPPAAPAARPPRRSSDARARAGTDRVAARSAPVAVVELLRGRDAERRRLLLVERAEPDHASRHRPS